MPAHTITRELTEVTAEAARRLVCSMNKFEARRLDLANTPTFAWPGWAQNDFNLACDALDEARVDPEGLTSPIEITRHRLPSSSLYA